MRRSINQLPTDSVEELLDHAETKEIALAALARISADSAPTPYSAELPPRFRVIAADAAEPEVRSQS